MKKRKYYLFFLIALPVLASLIFFSCPPLEEEPAKNIVKIKGDLTQSVWNDLLGEIYENAVLVNLDLSECTVPASGGDVLKHANENGSDYSLNPSNPYDNYIQFDPSFGGRFGKDLILSIILPDTATMISNASGDLHIEDIDEINNDETNSFAFRHFTKLKYVTGKNIRLIGTFAFYNCKTLTEANFPNVIHILSYAFYDCSLLKTINFEKVVDVLPSAFERCSSLERVDFHNVKNISIKAFKNCTGLKEINFLSATTIEFEAFRDCKNLKTARFLADPSTPLSGLPLDPWRSGNFITPYLTSSMAFHNNVFRGCSSLETLDIRRAWNVYFGAGALADIGKSLTLWLYDSNTVRDSNGKRGYGHPQVELLLGNNGKHPDLDVGELTLKTLSIIANTVEPFNDSQLIYADNPPGAVEDNNRNDDGFASIRNRINSVYNPPDRHVDFNEPKNPIVKVTVNGRPSASHQYDD